MSEQGYRVPDVCRIVGISYRQLDYWARTDLVTLGAGRPRLRDAAAVLVPGPRHAQGDQEPPGHRGVLQRVRKAVEHLKSMKRPPHGVTLMSDGRGVYEAHSPEAVIDLLQKGQGVFAIALDRVWNDLEGTLSKRRRAAAGGS